MARMHHAYDLDRQGWLKPHANVLRALSPNQDDRPEGDTPTLLVLHNISLPPQEFGGPYIRDFFQNKLDISAHPWFENIRDLKVSAHFLIQRTGHIIQFVPTTRRAWHAGVSRFKDRERCNDFSIGIELEGSDFEPFTEAQYRELSRLSRALRMRHNLRAVRGHEHIAPGRKTDPGPFFDWERVKREHGWPKETLPEQELGPRPTQVPDQDR